MLILDSLFQTPYEIYKPQEPKTTQQIPNKAESTGKSGIDWFLQTTLSTSTQKPKNLSSASESLLGKNPANQSPQGFSLSEKEILKEIADYSNFYRQVLKDIVRKLNIESCHLNGITLDKQDIKFIKKIDFKLKSNATNAVTLQEANESQKFLESRMDKIMLEIYKENPKVVKEMINKNYHFCAKDALERGDEIPKENEKISAILLEYGIKSESMRLEDRLKNFLAAIPTMIKNSIHNKEIDTHALKTIEENINLYRKYKIEATGYRLFASLTERFPPDEQEQIADSIAKVLSFYSQPNSLEAGGYKVSWQPKYLDAEGYHSIYGAHTAVSSVDCAEIEIAFQMLLVFPTNF